MKVVLYMFSGTLGPIVHRYQSRKHCELQFAW